MANVVDSFKAEARSVVLQEVLREKFIWESVLANTKFEWDFRSWNDTVHFPRLNQITIQDLPNSYSDVVIESLVGTDETFQLTNLKAGGYEISDVDMVEMYADPNSQAIQDLAQAFANAYDDVIMSEYASAGYVVDDGNLTAPTNGGAGNPAILSKLNIYDLVTACSEVMDSNNIPQENRFLVVSPKEKRLLANAPELLRSTPMGDGTVRNGFMGEIDGVAIRYSNNIKSVLTTKHLLAGSGKPVCFAANVRPSVEVARAPYGFRNIIKAMSKYGVKTFTEWANRLIDVQVSV